MEAVQTTAATTQAPTAVTAEGTLTWTQMEGTAHADQGSCRMMSQSHAMVSKDGGGGTWQYCYVLSSKIVLHGYVKE